ncbi:MAG: NAD-dependent epimerase/dehydratase family protein [Myxococcales bacterium]|nr:NAD-dependent epimerase/dehydratase family protein [Myxococcales bacterium]
MTSSSGVQADEAVAARRVAVTGASGFVGSHIALELVRAGAEAIGVVRSPHKAGWLESRGVALRRADLAEIEAMAEAFEGCDVVVANAALGSNQGTLDELVRANTSGVKNTLAAAANAGIRRVIYISSVAVYQNRPLRWQTEESPRFDTDAVAAGRRQRSVSDLTTDWRYAHSKALAEDLAWSESERLGLQLTSLRPGPVYGSRDPKLMPRLLRRLKLPVLPLPRVGMPLVHAADVALAVIGALKNPRSIGEAYNLSGPPTPLPEVFRELVRQGAAPGRRPVILSFPLPIWVGFDTSKAERDLGFRARSLREGFAEALNEPA